MTPSKYRSWFSSLGSSYQPAFVGMSMRPASHADNAIPDTHDMRAGRPPPSGGGDSAGADQRGLGSEVAAGVLLALDRLEQRLEVALAETERAMPLDDL